MKKIMNWVMAATLVCGTSVFTACTTTDDNPAQEQARQNRKEFIQHTRQNLKYLAENLNFTTWETINKANQHFNQYVLSNEAFKQSVMWGAFLNGLKNVQDVEPGSELAEQGFTKVITIDMNDFKYRFTQTADNSDFDREDAEHFEIILNGFSPLTQQVETGMYRVCLESAGTSIQRIVRVVSVEGAAIAYSLPSEFKFTMSANIGGDWFDAFTGTLHFQLPEGAEDTSLGYAADASVISHIPAGLGATSDDMQLDFSINSDRVNNTGNALISYVQNDRKMLELSIKESGEGEGGIRNFDLSEYTKSSSIFDVLAALMNAERLDEGKVTLLDDLTTTISISDMAKCVQVYREAAVARRHYADQATIDEYTQQLNALMTCEMTCKGINQTIPMCMVTTKFGIDYVPMPAFNFADENGFVSFIDLMDPESVQYGINIIDHAAEPMQQSVIVIRQLMEFVESLFLNMMLPVE